MFAKNRNLYLAQMETFTPDWSAFPTLDESTWIQLIEKELKGKPISSLDWAITPEITGRPAYHQPARHYGGPLAGGRHSGEWMIAEWVQGEQPEQTNQLAIEALTGGAQALVFELADLHEVLPLTEGIWMDMARIFWAPGQDVPKAAFADSLVRLSASRMTNSSSGTLLGGFITPTSVDDHLHMWHRFPEWQSVIAETGPAVNATRELGALLQTVRDWLEHPQATGDLAGSVMVRMEVGTDYLVEIARLRAWHILWGHLMQSFGWNKNVPCRILATISPDPGQAWETTYIASTTRALSAIFGGVDHLIVRPPVLERPTFAHRIARNIQHLMKEEGHLHRVIDPLAGSHAIEAITIQLAESAWSGLSS